MYETPDIPDVNTADCYEDTDSDIIGRLHLSSEGSNNKFKGKYLTGNIDYTHNDVRSGGCWELAAQGEKESPIEKYRRIKCEMDELMNEIVDINTSAAVSKNVEENYQAIAAAVSSAQKVLASLKLENVLGTEAVSSASDNEIKRLIAKVEDFRKNDVIKIPAGTSTNRNRNQNQIEQTRRMAEVEARLYSVEQIVNSQQPDKLNRLTSLLDTNGPLLDTVQKISTKAALLQPTQLDQIEARISALNFKLDLINDKTSFLSGKNGANDEKVVALYDVAKKIEPISKLLPDVLHRMQALESLHKHGEFLFVCMLLTHQLILLKIFILSANNFSKTITELESTQSALVMTLNGNKALLQNLQETFALNLENINQDVGKLETRLNPSFRDNGPQKQIFQI